MDIASLIGILGAIGMIVFAMVSGGGVGPFIDVPSILIVFGGTFFCRYVYLPNWYIFRKFRSYGKSFFTAS